MHGEISLAGADTQLMVTMVWLINIFYLKPKKERNRNSVVIFWRGGGKCKSDSMSILITNTLQKNYVAITMRQVGLLLVLILKESQAWLGAAYY